MFFSAEKKTGRDELRAQIAAVIDT